MHTGREWRHFPPFFYVCGAQLGPNGYLNMMRVESSNVADDPAHKPRRAVKIACGRTTASSRLASDYVSGRLYGNTTGFVNT